MEKVTLPQVRDLGQTIGDPFLFLRANFRFLLKSFLYFAVPPLVVGVGVSVFGFQKYFTGLAGSARYSDNTGAAAGFGALIMVAYLVFTLTLIFQQLYISEFMILKELLEDVTNEEVLHRIKADWKVILLTYLVMIPVSVLAGAVVFLVLRSAALFGAWLAGLLVFALYVFFIYSMIPLSNLLFIRLRERLGIMESLAKCFRITAGSWWRTFGAWLVVFMIFYVMFVSLLFPFAGISAIFNLHNISSPADPEANVAFVKSIMGVMITFGAFAFFFIMNLANVFIGINYFSLSERYDSYYLKREIEQIGAREDRNVHRQEGEY